LFLLCANFIARKLWYIIFYIAPSGPDLGNYEKIYHHQGDGCGEIRLTPEGWTAVSKALARLFGYLPPPGKIGNTNAKMVKIKNLS
jgi:hypothetical protein